jgi:DNA repair protein RecN (Recombination protein N)
MLVQLTVQNFVLIDALSIDFNRGLSVFTGETGAGKSLIVDAISLLSGDRASISVIANNKDKAVVEGVFQLEPGSVASKLAQEAGYDVSDVIVFTREITRDNKNICKINHRIVPLSTFKDILQVEIDIHSQHDTQYLLQDKHHMTLLDNYLHNNDLLHQVAGSFKEYQDKAKKVEAIEHENLSENDREFLEFQLNELALFNPAEDDYKECKSSQAHMLAFEKISGNTTQALDLLHQDEGVLEQVYAAYQLLDSLKEEEKIKTLSSSMMDVYATLEDIKETLADYVYSLSFDQEEFDDVMARLAGYDKLKRKHGGSIESVLEHKQSIEDTLYNLNHHQQVLEAAMIEQDKAFEAYQLVANQLSDSRKSAASKLTQEISKHLKDLQLPHAQFEVNFEIGKPTKKGMDKIVFYLKTNPGSAMAPLAKVASGGELSRLMLGLKAIFTPLQGCGTIIFDEIDVGVSGSVAHRVGRKMHELSQTVQTFAITHLPVVAAFGDQHLNILKHSTKDTTTVTIKQLTHNERIEQLALLASGQINEPSLVAAKSMLEEIQAEVKHG